MSEDGGLLKREGAWLGREVQSEGQVGPEVFAGGMMERVGGFFWGGPDGAQGKAQAGLGEGGQGRAGTMAETGRYGVTMGTWLEASGSRV